MTLQARGGPGLHDCFNPHPREAGDPGGRSRRTRRRCFNPHPREAGDPASSLLPLPSQVVSIHTRVKRVTQPSLSITGQRSGFNPHPREAGDIKTVPRFPFTRCFNPHPREAGDCYCCKCIINKELHPGYREPARFFYRSRRRLSLDDLYVLVNEQVTGFANLPGKSWALGVRGTGSKRATAPPDHTPAWPQSAQCVSANSCPDNRTAGCPSPGQPCR